MIQAKRTLLLLAGGMFLCIYGFAQNNPTTNPAVKADSTKKAPPTPPKPSVADKVKTSKKIDGLFTLYQDTANGSVQFYVKKNQLGKEYIYQSFSMGGPTSLFLHQNMIRTTWVFKIKKTFDKLEFSQVNTNFWYDPNNAVSKAANVDVTEAVFYSAKIDGEDSTGTDAGSFIASFNSSCSLSIDTECSLANHAIGSRGPSRPPQPCKP